MSTAGLEGLVRELGTCSRCPLVDRPFLIHDAHRRWAPPALKLLLITESPPPGRKQDFFYNLGRPDRLRRNLKAILGLGVAELQVPSWLKEHGAFLTNAIKCRPIRPGGRARDEGLLRRMALNCSAILARELEVLRPRRVMVFGRIAQLSSEVLGLEPYAVFPHPNFLVRFRRDMIPAVREAIFRALSGP
ncbi:hypothetical protein DRO32_02520 [Candidatus Bathyarchaeota archaeon]|nr:MAG: hypothetical protein DRO32_02520 [Candidatus Bathyarchaeota archaeon]